jgi:hypothetical protein
MEAQGLQEANVWKKLFFHEIVSIFILLCFLVGFSFFHWSYYLPLSFLLLGAIIWIVLRKHWNNMNVDRYNYRFATKHSLYMVLFSLIGTIIVVCSFRFSWFRDLFDYSMASSLDTWCKNITIICHIEYARYFFVFYLTIFGFFLPILKGYWHNRNVARVCMKKIKSKRNDYEKQTKDLQNEYEIIIEDYQQRENKISE